MFVTPAEAGEIKRSQTTESQRETLTYKIVTFLTYYTTHNKYKDNRLALVHCSILPCVSTLGFNEQVSNASGCRFGKRLLIKTSFFRK